MKSRPSMLREQEHFPAQPDRGAWKLSARTAVLVSFGLVCVVFAIYSPSLGFQFILDDHRFLSDPRIQQSGHLREYFSNYVWAQLTGAPPSFYRPLFVLWVRLNFMVSELSSWGWHFLSIAKHLLVGFVLGLLVWKSSRDSVAGIVAAALFLLHPAQTESVSWVTVPDPLMSAGRSEEHTSELQSRQYLVCRLLLEKKKNIEIQ